VGFVGFVGKLGKGAFWGRFGGAPPNSPFFRPKLNGGGKGETPFFEDYTP